jgi:hypothetical protein
LYRDSYGIKPASRKLDAQSSHLRVSQSGQGRMRAAKFVARDAVAPASLLASIPEKAEQGAIAPSPNLLKKQPLYIYVKKLDKHTLNLYTPSCAGFRLNRNQTGTRLASIHFARRFPCS